MVSIQVKIVGDFCNKRCTYCRDRDFDQGNKEVMSFVTLKNLINSLSKMSAPRQRMHWLGGEPLLAGLSFFEEVVRLQSEFPNVTWVNTIQTNAMLINENWAHFFEKQRFNVGVSVDGSKETHDTDRLTAGGLGSYDRVMNGVENLRRHNINPSVICVVTKKNANYGAVMLSSLVEAGFKKIAFNAFYNTATDFAGDVFAVDDNSWLKFLKDIFQEWVRINRSDIQVREIEEMLAWTKGRRANSCTFSGNCARWLVVDNNGHVYPCERLGKTRLLGTIDDSDSVQKILRGRHFQDFESESKMLPTKCQNCQMQMYCHNGCTAHRIDIDNKVKHYVYCESRLKFYDHLTKRLAEL